VLGDRLGATGDPSILDVGCGSGQIAQMLNDMGFTKYVGFDFSPKRIEWARQEVPTYRFELADAYETTLFADTEYDSVVCTEFLEHVEGDLAVLDRVRPGTRFLGTVPDFGGGSHVRFFRSAGEVEDRYAEQFSPFQVSTFVRPGGTSRQFLIDGVKN
jgi:SAM-dependent methyltransferase